MKTQSNTIQQLIDILNKLDAFVSHYPIYIYLIDKNYHLVWYNQYLGRQFNLQGDTGAVHCYKALWGFNNPCKDCPSVDLLTDIPMRRDVLKRLHPQSQDEMSLQVLSFPIVRAERKVEGVLKIAVDVTTQEREQLALREKEKLFTSIIDTSADAVFFLDNEERISSWNKGAQDIFGYSPEEIIGKSSVLLIPKELIELGEQYYIKQELEKKGFIRKYETQRLHQTGQLIYVDLTRTVIRDQKGKAVGSSVIIKDITTRKELEFELRRTILELSKLNELNEIFHTTYLLEDILRMVLIAITAGEGLRFNRAFLFLLDTEKQVLNGHMAVGPENESEAHRIWSSLKDHFRSLKEIVEQFQIDFQGSDLKLNQLVHQINIPLQESENILIKTLQKRQTHFIRGGKSGNKPRHAVDDKNRYLFDLLGTDTLVAVPLVTKKEAIGVIVADNKITRRDITAEEIESLKLFATQASMAIENARLYRNLEERINELQEAYRKLEEHSQRLVKAERLAAIGEMSAKIAHEIRNPLVSIGGFARLMEKKLPAHSQLRKYTSIISAQVANLESILNNILNIARHRKPERRRVDVHQVVHHVLMMMDEVIDKRIVRINLQFQCPQSLVWGDEKLLHQAVLNLVKNALEAMREEGVLTIKTQCEEYYLHLQIQDTGRGISDDHLRKIYDPFFTTKTEGTGLGLSIVKQIIHDHKGKMELFSTPKQGTRVSIFLPRYIEQNHRKQRIEKISKHSKQKPV